MTNLFLFPHFVKVQTQNGGHLISRINTHSYDYNIKYRHVVHHGMYYIALHSIVYSNYN